jgi:hypothetical protein
MQRHQVASYLSSSVFIRVHPWLTLCSKCALIASGERLAAALPALL